MGSYAKGKLPAGGMDREAEPGMTPMELKYCERCGALGVKRAASGAEEREGRIAAACGACRASLRWLYGEEAQ